MKILLISQWFNPEPTFKGLSFALELMSRGHEVQVLTGFPNYPGGKVYDGYKICIYQHQIMQGIHVHRVPLYPNHDQSVIKRIANYLTFALAASIAINFVMSRPDVAYVYHPPLTTSMPAIVQKLFRGVPFVYDIQDLWPDTLVSTGMILRKWQLSMISKWCNCVYKSASILTVISEGFKKKLIERGVPERKIRVIHNWCEETSGTKQCGKGEKPALFQNRFTIMYAGNFGKAQGLEIVLEAAKIVEATAPKLQFVLIGSGVEGERLKAQATNMKLTNVVFYSRLPMSEIASFMENADAFLVLLRADPLFKITIPSKTQAYMAIGKPIIMAVEGDAANLVASARCGVTCDSGNATALASAVMGMSKKPKAELELMGRSGKSFYESQLSLSKGVSHFENIFQEVQDYITARSI
jgi:glycosyltransferase involved in cell wall biosynthesis